MVVFITLFESSLYLKILLFIMDQFCSTFANHVETNITGLASSYFFDFQNSVSPNNFSQVWILASGATDHIPSRPSIFSQSSSSSTPSSVKLPTGANAPIHSIGSISFDSNISLHNVLCVPSFRINLMSISKLTKSLNCCVLFFPDFCLLQDLAMKKTIDLGK